MLVAIIGAYQTDAAQVPLVTLPLGGATLGEHQVRRAIAAGADRLILLVDEPSAALADLTGRLRRDGIDIQLAAGLGPAADHLPAEARVLLLADGCLPAVALLAGIASAMPPALAVLPDAATRDHYERIDAEVRWAGLALLDGAEVIGTAAMLGGWDPVSTLLRRAVQAGATRIDASNAPPPLLRSASDIVSAERLLSVAARRTPRDWIGRVLLPIEDVAVPLLLARRIEPGPVAIGAAALALLSGLAALDGLPWPALIGLLAATPLAGIAVRLARIQARPLAHARQRGIARGVGAGTAAIGLAWMLAAASGQWGWWLVAAILIGTMLEPGGERSENPPGWAAERATLPWLLLPFALFGRWDAGLAVLAGYAVLSVTGQRWSTGT